MLLPFNIQTKLVQSDLSQPINLAAPDLALWKIFVGYSSWILDPILLPDLGHLMNFPMYTLS